MFTLAGVEAFITVAVIDLVLAGDNAVVIGMAAAGLPRPQRGKAILIGILVATALRIAFALAASRLLTVIGLLLAGGILLLWVCWKMWRELRAQARAAKAEAAGATLGDGAGLAPGPPAKSMGQAVLQIILADVSMSLDNVLGVAGAAYEHPFALAFGLTLSVLLMGAAASIIARILNAHRWIAYIGLAVILFVAVKMIFDGGMQVYDCHVGWRIDATQHPLCPAPFGAGHSPSA